MKEYGLTKSERLYLREEIRQLFESRSRFVCYPYRVVWRLEEPSVEPLKVLISVPKRLIRHAVDRNTIKRRTREAWRLQKGPLRRSQQSRRRPSSWDCSISVIMSLAQSDSPQRSPSRLPASVRR